MTSNDNPNNEKFTDDKLSDRAEQAYSDLTKKRRFKSEPSLWEANISFFMLLFFTSTFSVMMPILIPVIPKVWFIIIAAILLVSTIPMYLIGDKVGGFGGRVCFYLGFLFSIISLSSSLTAILAYTGKSVTILESLYAAIPLFILSIVSIVVLSTPSILVEKVGICVMTVLSLALMITAITLIEKFGVIAIIVAFASGVMFLQHIAMAFYVFTGEGFFAVLPMIYFAIAFFALIIAILVALQADSCDCDCGADCCDVSPRKGGRRKRV